MVVLVHDDDQRLGGVVMASAESVTAEQVNFMARNARGLVSLALTPERCSQLALPAMAGSASSAQSSRFRVSIEAAEGIEPADYCPPICWQRPMSVSTGSRVSVSTGEGVLR